MDQKENTRIISYADRRSNSPSLENCTEEMSKLKKDLCNLIVKYDQIWKRNGVMTFYDTEKYYGIQWLATWKKYNHFKDSI